MKAAVCVCLHLTTGPLFPACLHVQPFQVPETETLLITPSPPLPELA